MGDYIARGEAERRLFQRAEIANSAYIDQSPYQIMMLAQNVVHLIPAADVREAARYTPHMQEAIDSVIAERRRQISMWGDQSGTPLYDWLGLLGEEFGELCEAVNETCFERKTHPERGGMDNIYKEASHVAAVAVQLMEAILAGFRQADATKEDKP